MIKGNITRTFYYVQSSGYVLDGLKDDGTPKLTQVFSNEYVTTNPNDMALAKREVKLANKKVMLDTVSTTVNDEVCIAMSLQKFFEDGDVVTRQENGRIK